MTTLCLLLAVGAPVPMEPATQLEVFRVLEDPVGVVGFNYEVDMRGLGLTGHLERLWVTRVLPNTAASKAGLRPGDRILRTEGRAVAGLAKSEFDATRREKQRLGEAGSPMTWELLVQSAKDAAPRLVRLVLPAPAPWWGAPHYAAPEGRLPANVAEPGPLAEKAKVILDQGVWSMLPATVARALGLRKQGDAEFLGYEWAEDAGGETHVCFVSQRRGGTDVVLIAYAKGVFSSAPRFYLTGPDGRLVRAVVRKGGATEIPWADADKKFRAEVDLWTTHIAKVSPRWPLGLLPTKP